MWCDKTPQLQTHTRKPACGSDDSDQESVEDHHVECANAACDTRRKSHECDAHIVGHDGAGGDRLDPHDGMGPHLMALDSFHHLRPEDLYFEIWIMIRQRHAGDGGPEENAKCG